MSKKISQLIIFGELLKIDSSVNDKKELVHRMYFKVMEYDKGLEEEVPKSIAVKLSPEHNELHSEYSSHVGKVISVPVAFTAVNGDVYYRTSGDGKMLNLVQDKPVKVVSTT